MSLLTHITKVRNYIVAQGIDAMTGAAVIVVD